MSQYQVIGQSAFRGYTRGQVFEANLEPFAEKRAIARRNIRLIKTVAPKLQPGSYRLPDGWANPDREV